MSGKQLMILIIVILFGCMNIIPLMAQTPSVNLPAETINVSPVVKVSGNQVTVSDPAAGNLSPKIGKILIVFLVLSIVFEVALTPIFNWRFFLQHCEGKGYKTPVTVSLAFLVFWNYDLDIVKDLLNALDYQAKMSVGGQFLTALLIAGGSDGIFRIFTKLGIRNPIERKEKADEARDAMRKQNSDKARSAK